MENSVKHPSRRHDLDFVRVAAFALLIPYHASLFFGLRNFYVNADQPSRIFELFELAIHPWRMTVLFLLSGIATAFLARNMSLQELWLERTRRILTPFVIGMLVCAPPQYFVAIRTTIDTEAGLFDSCLVFFHLLPEDEGDARYPGNELFHMWFLLYLFAYVCVWLGFAARYAAMVDRMRLLMIRLLAGPFILLAPIIFYATAHALLYPQFGEKLVIHADWYLHVIYFATFVLGYLIAFENEVWNRIVEARQSALVLALLAFAVCAYQFYGLGLVYAGTVNPIARAILNWSAVIAIFGYARAYVTSPNPIIRYLNRGVLSYYLTHQTIMVLVGYWLHENGMLTPSSYLVIVAVTFAGSAAIYEGQRRLMALRPGAVVRSGTR